MHSDRQSALLRAYFATCYRVSAKHRQIDIRIGRTVPEIGTLIRGRTQAKRPWYYISAFNPESRMLDAAENRQRHQHFLQWLDEHGYRHWPGRAVADDGQWPDETGLLIAGGDMELARFARDELQQYALVWGRHGQAARLLLLQGGWPLQSLPSPDRQFVDILDATP